MDKKQVGKLFIIGYQGEQPSDEFLSFVNEWGIGGVIVFARNLSDPLKLPENLKKIREAACNNIFTAIDQEGGLVLRILSHGSLFPSAMALSAANDIALTEKVYRAIGEEMLSLGLNWNLAPVLDINHPSNPGIGARSFADNPQKVAEHGIAAIKGLQSTGVMACAKHFPGKGEAKKDSHLTLPTIPFSAERLRSFELFPFKKAIENNVSAVMTSHVFFPAFEKTPNLPITLSKAVLTDLLRRELGFKGLLITDDLEMGAITESYGIAQAALKSFLAGADQLLICHSLDQQRVAAETILKEIDNNPEAAKRLEESLSRIELAKSKLPLPGYSKISLDQLSQNHKPLIEEVSEKSIKFLSVDDDDIPLKDSKDTHFILPLISSLVQVEEEHKEKSLANIVKKYFPNSICDVYEPKATSEEILNGISFDNDSKIVFMTYNGHLFKEQIKAAKLLSGYNKEIIVIALRNPYDIFECDFSRTKGVTFGFRTPAISAILEVLKGTKKPTLDNWPIDTSINYNEI
jgi:beta-N-acetylhexosaminidase